MYECAGSVKSVEDLIIWSGAVITPLVFYSYICQMKYSDAWSVTVVRSKLHPLPTKNQNGNSLHMGRGRTWLQWRSLGMEQCSTATPLLLMREPRTFRSLLGSQHPLTLPLLPFLPYCIVLRYLTILPAYILFPNLIF